MARRLELDVDARELARLRPMVQDVLEVGQRLRRDYAPPIDRPARRSG